MNIKHITKKDYAKAWSFFANNTIKSCASNFLSLSLPKERGKGPHQGATKGVSHKQTVTHEVTNNSQTRQQRSAVSATKTKNMAKYDQTPVFKETYDLTIKLYEISPKLSRDVRYTIAEDLKKDTMYILKMIYLANFKSATKEQHIKEALTTLATVRLQLRILKDLKQVSTKSYAQISLMTASIAAQLTAWLKYTKANKGQATPETDE